MKILHLFSSKVFAGLERHVEELSFEQSKSHEITVIGPERFKNKFRANYTSVNTNQWRYSPILWLELRDAMVRINPEIVHTHGQKMTNFIKADLHFSTIHGTKKNVAAFKKTQFIFGASNKSLEQIPPEKSMVLENWVDESRFNNYKQKDPEYFLYIGRFEPVKNPERLIRAWKSEYGKLLMVGSGQLEKDLIVLIKQLGLDNIIELHSETDDVGSLLSKAHALIISSDREGSPKVLYESLYCKVPVLSTDCGNIAEILPNQSIAETNDQSFQHLLKKWAGKINELSLLQKKCFNEVGSKNLLSIQTKKVNEKYQEFLSMASR
ncbi:MAG: glycosyltransferase [SAR86 cluster bacterium]|uniref:Glycosyltransferase n=1 Tax=SAR86 cluster bacterium TaxID=2030880 RepID=A0A520MSE4_9GAMM|nr:MAG: glycosyltransferase [SAR86 cluster bacterium]|tara:strand:- start:116 stop:1084 length:969 start_codon:yes stop_codon:yes gene_type:complete